MDGGRREKWGPVGWALLAVLVLLSCGRRSDTEDESESEARLLKVTGSLVDWGSSAGTFSGYHMVLQDADTGEAFRDTFTEGPVFSIEKVPSDRRYLALLLDPEFRFGWMLQIASQEKAGKSFQVFQFGSQATLGSLTLEGRVLRSSEQSSLTAVSTLPFRDANRNGIPDGLEEPLTTPYATAANAKGDLDSDKVKDILDHDVDNDGVPNNFDLDVDDDGILDLFDLDVGQDGVLDVGQPWMQNLSVYSSRIGFRHVFHEVKVNDDDSESVNMWFVLGAKLQSIKSAKVVSGRFLENATYAGGGGFTGELYDDATHGDGVAGDSVWSAMAALSAGQMPSANQVVSFQVTWPDRSTSEFFQKVGTIISGGLNVNAALAEDGSKVTVSWTPGGAISENSQLTYQVLVLSAEGKRVYTSEKLSHDLNSLEISTGIFPAGGTYSVEVRAMAPSPLNGFPGSVKRSKAATFTR